MTAINGWYDSAVSEIATPETAAGQSIVEAKAGTNMNGTTLQADFMMIGVSEYSTAYLTESATRLIDNACRYLLGINIDTTVTNLQDTKQTYDDVIYTLMGIAVGKGKEDLKCLPAGIYIMNGKVVVR